MENKQKSPDAPSRPHCTGDNCDYAVCGTTGEIYCMAGIGTCINCNLLESELSTSHDQHLAKATRKINQILNDIPDDPNGRQLAFLVTKKGLLLARVHHGKEVPENVVTAKDDTATISKALQLKD